MIMCFDSFNNSQRPLLFAITFAFLFIPQLAPAEEELGAMWGTAEAESNYYRLVDIPIPPEIPMRPGSFEILPDGRLAVGTRR